MPWIRSHCGRPRRPVGGRVDRLSHGRRLSRLALGALVAGSALGCGGASESEPEAPAALVHLDPRLEGGVSPAAALAGAREVVAQWRFEHGATDLGPWKPVRYSRPRRSLAGGLTLRPDTTAGGRPLIVYEGEAAAADFNVIELDVAVEDNKLARFVWKHGESPAKRVYASDRRDSSDGARRTLVFSMPSGGGWEGALERLHLEQSTTGMTIEVYAIRFVRAGFELGHSPTGGDSGDGGLLTVGGESRRSWPMPLDDPLICEATVPVGGRLSFGAAIPADGRRLPLELAVEVAPLDGGGDPIVHRRSWSVDDPSRGSWEPIDVDLSALAGERVQVAFQASSSAAGPGDDGRAVLLLGTPVLAAGPEVERPPNVLLVTIDTTRFDALGPALTGRANDLATTPFLTELSADGLVFTEAWSAANSTQPSHASILTGLAVQDHNLHDNYGVLDPSAVTLAELLRDRGYATGGIVSLEAIGATSGFGQGFDRMAPPGPISHLDGRDRVDAAQRWIEEWSAHGDQPFFLWLHLFDPHTPYEPSDATISAYTADAQVEVPPKQIDPPSLFEVDQYLPEVRFLRGINNERFPRFLYHSEVHYADGLLRDLYATLDASGDGEQTLSIITSDHGENLGERNVYYVHTTLLAETLHVPLLIRPPGGTERRMVSTRVTTRDVVPTVVSYLGIDAVPERRDLLAVAAGSGDDERVFWFEQANRFQVGCRDERYHFVTTTRAGFTMGLTVAEQNGARVLERIPVPKGTSYLFDHTVDPELENDLSAERPDLVEFYLGALAEYRAAARPLERVTREISDEQEDKLRNLGYMRD